MSTRILQVSINILCDLIYEVISCCILSYDTDKKINVFENRD